MILVEKKKTKLKTAAPITVTLGVLGLAKTETPKLEKELVTTKVVLPEAVTKLLTPKRKPKTVSKTE
jgi:hypothetical protein